MILNKQVRVYVPGTVQGNVEALDEQKIWVRRVMTKLSTLFGGATAIKAEGAYMSDTLGLIVEPVVIVSAHCDVVKLTKHRDDVIRLAREVRTAMSQECVSVEFNGTMELVSEAVNPAA